MSIPFVFIHIPRISIPIPFNIYRLIIFINRSSVLKKIEAKIVKAVFHLIPPSKKYFVLRDQYSPSGCTNLNDQKDAHLSHEEEFYIREMGPEGVLDHFLHFLHDVSLFSDEVSNVDCFVLSDTPNE